MKTCPFCAEEIQDAAVVCKHCGRELGEIAKPARAEKVYLKEKGTIITSTRAIIGGATYTMGHITSVKVATMKKSQTLPLLVIIAGIASFFSGFGGENTGICIGTGVLLLLCGIVWAIANKDKYAVRIGSSSGEADALSSTNEEQIKKIVNALQKAIVDRG